MKSVKARRIMSVALSVFVFFGMISFCAGEVNAAGVHLILDPAMYVGQEQGVYVDNGTDNGAKVTKVTSDDKSVIDVDKYTYYDLKNKKHTAYDIVGKHAGETKVHITYKKKNGSKATITRKITVKKYPNQIAKLKVNGKSVSLKKHPFFFDKKYKGTKVKVKMTVAEGWKINFVSASVSNIKTGKEIKVKKADLIKGKTFSFPKKYKDFSLYVEFKNIETGDLIYYNILNWR